MASVEDADMPLDDFYFLETDTLALSLVDFDPVGSLLMPSELDMSQTQLQQTQQVPFSTSESDSNLESYSDHNTDSNKHCKVSESSVNISNGRTDVDGSSPLPFSVQQQTPLCSVRFDVDLASPPAKIPAYMDRLVTTHSPLLTEQKLLAPRTSNSSNADATVLMQPSGISLVVKSSTFPDTLPYAMSKAYVPLNLSHGFNDTFMQRIPKLASSSTSDLALPSATIHSIAESNLIAKKSKREIRQMKNRESANKSRIRRKAELTMLTAEVVVLRAKEQELQTIITGLRAENKSLLDQNTFLRSLVTAYKHEPGPSSNHMAATASAVEQDSETLSMLERGEKVAMNGELQSAHTNLTTSRPSKRRAITSNLSVTSLAVCASVFGVTIFTAYDGKSVNSGKIRSISRVLLEVPSKYSLDGCNYEASPSLAKFAMSAVRSWWHFLFSSELIFGVQLNVLLLIAIMVLFQIWQLHSKERWLLKLSNYNTVLSTRSSLTMGEMKCGQDLRVRVTPHHYNKCSDTQ